MALKLSPFIERAGLRALHFATGGFGKAADTYGDHFVHAEAEGFRDTGGNLATNCGGVRGVALRRQDQPLLAEVLDAEGDHIASTHAG